MSEIYTSGCEYCVICGAPVPEGRQICAQCESKITAGKLAVEL